MPSFVPFRQNVDTSNDTPPGLKKGLIPELFADIQYVDAFSPGFFASGDNIAGLVRLYDLDQLTVCGTQRPENAHIVVAQLIDEFQPLLEFGDRLIAKKKSGPELQYNTPAIMHARVGGTHCFHSKAKGAGIEPKEVCAFF